MSLARKLLALAALGLSTGLAQAGNINWSIGINLPAVGTVISSAPVYVQPAPYRHPVEIPYDAPPPVVYYQPAPVYYSPRPAVVYRPVPIYASSPVYVVDHRLSRARQWEHRGPRERHWDSRGYDFDRGQFDRRGGHRNRD